jgi:hypothetical protein
MARCESCGGSVGLNARNRPRKFCLKPECQTAQRSKAGRRGAARYKNRKTKVCPACGKRKPLTEKFWGAMMRAEDGSIVRWQGYCRPCKHADSIARLHTDARRRKQACRRAAQARERRKLGIPADDQRRVATPEVDREDDAELPIEPFAKWLEGRLLAYGGVERLASVVGINDSTPLRRIIDRSDRGRPKKFVRLSFVDRCLTREGSRLLFDLYPELYPDVEVDERRGVAA